MAKSDAIAESPGTKYMLLALGLLIGFVIGFVLLLSSLPVDSAITIDARPAAQSRQAGAGSTNYEFYNMLPEKPVRAAPARASVPQQSGGGAAAVIVADTPAAEIAPSTRVVPANAQNFSNDQIAEMPASYGAQSFYLQAGSFPQQIEAETMRATVILLGLEAFIVTRQEADGAIRHRVRVGPYRDLNLLTEAKKRLRRGGIVYDVVRVTGTG